MATFLNDTFTGTSAQELSAHTGETGATWTKHPSSDASCDCNLSDANRLRKGTTVGLSVYYASATPGSADYEVVGTIYPRSNIGECGVIGRANTTQQTWYEAKYQPGGPWIAILKRVNGGNGTPAQNIHVTITQLTLDTSHTIALRMVGPTIKVFLDDVEQISITDSEITAAGKAGTFMYEGGSAGSNTTHVHLDSITAADFEPTGAFGGTGGSGMTEAEVVAGAKTITVTLTGETFIA